MQAGTLPHHHTATEGTHIRTTQWPQALSYTDNIRPVNFVLRSTSTLKTLPWTEDTDSEYLLS